MSQTWLISLISVSVGVLLGFLLNQLKEHYDTSKKEARARQRARLALLREISRNLTLLKDADFLELGGEDTGVGATFLFIVPLDTTAWETIKDTDYLDDIDEKTIADLGRAYSAIKQYNRCDVLSPDVDLRILTEMDITRIDISEWLNEAVEVLREKMPK